jgi:MFS family permease
VIIGAALILGLVVAWALGARLTNLSEIRFRGDWMVFAALGIQAVIFTPAIAHLPDWSPRPLHVASYVMLIAFLLRNVRLPGFWMVGVGVACNATVILLNEGYMPVTLSAWRATGASARQLLRSHVVNNNVLVDSHTHLAFLGDIFALPAQVPLANALSIGDVLMVLGAVAFVYRSCCPPLVANAPGVLAPLRYAGFRRVIAGRMASKLGDWLTQAAVVTWVWTETHSTLAVSVYLITRMASFTLGGIVSAPMLARLQGFRVLSVVEVGRGVATIAMIPLAMSGMLWPVVAVGGVSSFLASATAPSASSLVPEVLPGELIQAGNALHGVARNVTLVFGAGAGGFLVATFGIAAALGVDVLTFLVSAILYFGYIERSGIAPPDRGATSHRELLSTVLTNRVVLGLTASFTVATAATGLLNSSVPHVFDTQLGDPTGYGLALAVLGCGFIAGELLTGFMERESVARRSVGLALAGQAGLLYVVANSNVTATVLLMFFLLGASDGVTEVVYDTLIQIHVRRELRAGVFALARSVQNVGMIAGLASAPLLVGHASTKTALLVSASGFAAAAGFAAFGLVLQPRLRHAVDRSLALLALKQD